MRDYLFTPFLIALQFLTRIPVPKINHYSDVAQARSLLFYPLVGIIIGGVLLLAPIPMNTPALSAACLLGLWVIITGGLHLDGLADSADAWAGGYGNAEKTLQIMKDPRSGPMAVAVLLITLLIKFAALFELIRQQNIILVWLAPVLGRTAVIGILLSTAYVRENGLGEHLCARLPKIPAISVLIFTIVLIVGITGLPSVLVIVGVLAVTAFLRVLMLQRIQGTTGDTLGAVIEIAETTAICLTVWLMVPSA